MSQKLCSLRARALACLWHLGQPCAVVLTACASNHTVPQSHLATRGDPVVFSFLTSDGVSFDSQGTRGRVTAILLITTYDLTSQLVARRLNDLLSSFRPRFNVAAVVLEPPKYAVLLEPFKSSLGLRYPVVLADYATLRGDGIFGKIPEVPIVIVLDPEGRPVWRLAGPATEQQIKKALREAGPDPGKMQ